MRGRRTSRSPAPRTRRQGAPGRDAGPRSTWMAVSLTPARYSSHAAGPCNDKRATAIGAAGSTVMDGQSSRPLARQSVSLAEIPSCQRLSPICPQRRARHARRAAGFWLPARSPEHQVRPGRSGGQVVPPRCPVTSRGPLTNHQLPPRYGLAGQRRIDSGTAGPELVMTASAALTGPGPSDQLSDNRARDTRMTVDSETPFTCSDDKQDRSQDCFGTKRRPAAC